jgi:predicted Rossmann fold nucleotide-binding protein DprA/Smf involved in DNA uptake
MKYKIITYHNGEFCKKVAVIGDKALLDKPKVGFFCSSKCPGELILQSYDLAQCLRRYNISVMSGFQSPVEEQCFRVLSKGMQPLLFCPARNISRMRVPAKYRRSIQLNRMTIVSPFIVDVPRVTRETAFKRNHFIASVAEAVFIVYASSSSRTYRLCEDLLSSNADRILTFKSKWNQPLIDLGVKAVSLDGALSWFDENGFVQDANPDTSMGLFT